MSSLLSLPAELRNQIYENVFQGWVIVIRPNLQRQDRLEADIWSVTNDPFQTLERQAMRQANKPSNPFSLLYTCRQIHAEARHLPCRLNTLLCGEKPVPYVWLVNLREQLAQIRTLQLCSYTPANLTLSRTWLAMLPWFTGLRKVEVYWQLSMPSWGEEEDHLATAVRDEVEMEFKIRKTTPTTRDVVFHRIVCSE